MEVRVSSMEADPKRWRLFELPSPVRKPCSKAEEMDDMTDFGINGFCLLKEDLSEKEDTEVDKKIIKSIVLDDKEQLVILTNLLVQNSFRNGEPSMEEELDGERAEWRGIVSKLLQSCCLFDSEKCATALLDGEVLGTSPLVNEMDEYGLSPLHTAATVHAVKCIELLLRKKARTDIKSKDERSQVALELSLSSRRMEVVWKVGDPIEDLLVCLNQKNLSAVRLLAEKTKEIGQVAYSIATNGQAVSLAALLMVASEKVLLPSVGIQSNGDPGSKEKTTIYDCLMNEALALGREEYSSVLTWSTRLSKTFGCTNESDDSAESITMRRKLLLCEMELCQLFGAAPQMSMVENKAASPLIYAIQAADLEVVKLILDTGVNINETDDQGNTALHWALKMNSALCLKQMKIIGLLIQHGARVTKKNKLGLTALHIAASNGNFQAIQILISEEHNSVHSVTEMKETPLFFAVKNDHKECVELLLRSGANSEVLNIRKQRPIDFATSQDIRFILNPTNIRLSHPTPQNQQRNLVHSKGISRGFCSTLSTTGNENSISERLSSLISSSTSKSIQSSHGCVRGDKCFYAHDGEHSMHKSGQHPSGFGVSDLRRRIFVGGLPASIDSDSLGKYFKHFGCVEDAFVVETQSCDQSHSRGFGFVTFKNEKSVTVAVQAQYIPIMGKAVEIKSFLSRSPPSELGKVQPKIDLEYVGLGLQAPCTEVKSPVEDNFPKKSWVDTLFHNLPVTSPLGLQAQACHSVAKVTEPEWLSVFRKWFPSFIKKKFKCLGKGDLYALSSLKADFKAMCGLELDHSSIGYSKLRDFLISITDICHVKYVPMKGKSSLSHMVIIPNHFTTVKRLAEPMKSPDAHSHSESSGSCIDGCLEDSKFIDVVVSLPADLKGFEVSDNYCCELIQDLFTESPSSLDCMSSDVVDDFMLPENKIQSCFLSYNGQSGDSNGSTLLPNNEAQLSSLSSEGNISNISTDFLFEDLWLNHDRPSSPICIGSTDVTNAPIHEGDHKDSVEDTTFLATSFLQFLSPDPIFLSRPWLTNESYRGVQSAEIETHPVLEYFTRNSTSIFFLREFDFYMKYNQCLREEKCFSCNKQRMSWANYPCNHLLWCDECQNHVMEATRGEHKCVICDAKVQKLLHNFNSTSWSKVIQPHCVSIVDYKEFPSLDPIPIHGRPNSPSRKIKNESITASISVI